MQKLVFPASTLFLVLAAACSPADSVPAVHAQAYVAAAPLHPDVAPGSGDGHVHEYH